MPLPPLSSRDRIPQKKKKKKTILKSFTYDGIILAEADIDLLVDPRFTADFFRFNVLRPKTSVSLFSKVSTVSMDQDVTIVKLQTKKNETLKSDREHR